MPPLTARKAFGSINHCNSTGRRLAAVGPINNERLARPMLCTVTLHIIQYFHYYVNLMKFVQVDRQDQLGHMPKLGHLR